MNNEIIDVEYVKKPSNNPTTEKPSEITINADPYSAAISEATGLIKEGIRCHIEYKQCKEHEETERQRIKLEYKQVIKELELRHEQIMATINNAHEQAMLNIRSNHEIQKMLIANCQEQISRFIAENNNEMVKFVLQYQMNAVNAIQNNNSELVTSFNPNLLFSSSFGINLLE